MATIDGTSDADTLVGTAGNDLISGSDGNDSLNGVSGSDTLIGGSGVDTIIGSPFALADGGRDLLIGGAGRDSIYHNAGWATIYGGEGEDTIRAVAPARINGGDGEDNITFLGGTAFGGSGEDNFILYLQPGNPLDTNIDGGPSDYPDRDDDAVFIMDERETALTVDQRAGAKGKGNVIGITDVGEIRCRSNSTLITVLGGDESTDTEIEYYAGPTPTGGEPALARMWMGAGDDQVEINQYRADIRLGAGDDVINFYSVKGGYISGGDGTDDLYVIFTPGIGPIPAPSETITINARAGATSRNANELALAEVEKVELSGWYNHTNPTAGRVIYLGGDAAVDLRVAGMQLTARLGSGADLLTIEWQVRRLDVMLGGGNDSLVATRDDWTQGVINAGDGDDEILVHQFSGRISGGLGDDVIQVDALLSPGLVTTLLGEGGADQITASGPGRYIIDGGLRSDLIRSGSGADLLDGGHGQDTLIGGGGNDVMQGGAGADRLDGGSGIDRARYLDATGAVVVDLMIGSRNRGEARGDQLTGIENLVGSDFGDRLAGDSGDNSLWGGKGNDRLNGRDGDDYLLGGAGADTFVYSTGPGRDVIADFQDGLDQIDLRDHRLDNFAQLRALGTEQNLDGDARLDTVLDFGGGRVLVVMDTSLAALADDVLL